VSLGVCVWGGGEGEEGVFADVSKKRYTLVFKVYLLQEAYFTLTFTLRFFDSLESTQLRKDISHTRPS
jgi:hypothetical protein